MGSVHTAYDWDWAAGAAALKQAALLAPREPITQFFTAREAIIVGHYDDALAHMRATLAQDPLMPTAHLGICWIQQRRGHLAEAESAVRRALEIIPTYVSAHFYLGQVLLARGESEAALVAMQEETPLGGKLGGLALAYYALGRKAESDAALSQFIKEQPDWPFAIAEVYAYRGELDSAFEWLDRAYSIRDSSLYLIKGDPSLKNLEGDSRYKAFLKRMNLPE